MNKTAVRKTTATKKRASANTAAKLVLLSGASGKMGQELQRQISATKSLRVGACVDDREIRALDSGHTAVLRKTKDYLTVLASAVDVIIDFSTPKGTRELLSALSGVSGKVILIGTTGLTNRDLTHIKKLAKKGRHQVLVAGNTSLGIATLVRACLAFASSLSEAGFDIEITESHHNRKADAPSGTALLLARSLQARLKGYRIETKRSGKRQPKTIGVHSVRGGGVVGEHEVRFISDYEEVKFSHRAFSRALFADGAIRLIAEIEKNVKIGEMTTFEDLIARIS